MRCLQTRSPPSKHRVCVVTCEESLNLLFQMAYCFASFATALHGPFSLIVKLFWKKYRHPALTTRRSRLLSNPLSRELIWPKVSVNPWLAVGPWGKTSRSLKKTNSALSCSLRDVSFRIFKFMGDHEKPRNVRGKKC